MTDTATDPIAAHHTALLHAFAKVVQAERAGVAAQAELQQAEARLKPRVAAASKALADAWSDVEALLADTGETEVVLPYAAGVLARVHYTTPGVKCVVDPEACPEEYLKVEKKPKLNDVKRDFLELWKAGAHVPNWVQFVPGEARLTWEPAKQPTKGDI